MESLTTTAVAAEPVTVGDYNLTAKIGGGTTSTVWKAEQRTTGQVVALKQVRLSKLTRRLKSSLDCELNFLSSVNHPNIVRLLDVFQTEDCIFLVLEFCAGGNLSSYIQLHGRVQEQIAREFMLQLGAGLKRTAVVAWCLMESPDNKTRAPCRIGDRSTSDVVVRLRTQEGRDEWVYCHSHVLVNNSKYFSDRLSENWPTCQILDSRNCVEVYCQESELDYHINVLRLFYDSIDCSVTDVCHGVRNTLGVLRVANELGCPQIIAACVDYLEAVSWEETEEEEILRTIPGMGSQAEPILARLQPVNTTAIVRIFLAAIRFATSSPSSSLTDLKTSAQEQLEYMLTEDDDAPLLTVDDQIKSEVQACVNNLFARFTTLVESLLCKTEEPFSETGKVQLFRSYLTDLSWACQILVKLDIMREFVMKWMEASESIVKAVDQASPEAEILEFRLKIVEITAKILEPMAYGTAILPTAKRLKMVKVWLPFVRVVKPLIDAASADGEEGPALKMDGELWQSLESAFVSIILALPSGDQAEILTEWLQNKHIRYPDLTEAFEVWCYRSKVAKRRLASFGVSIV